MLVNAIWIDGPLPLLERMCARSWLAHGHRYQLWSYEDLEGVPEGVQLEDANAVLPGPIRRYQDTRHQGSPILHANLFRYQYLSKSGGCFIDADTLCLQAFDLADELVVSSEDTGSGVHPNLSLLNVPRARRSLAAACRSEAWRQLDQLNLVWGHYGPKLLKRCLELSGATRAVRPPRDFSPIHWSRTDDLFAAEPPDLEGALAVQLWHNTLRSRGVDLTAEYPPTSLWSQWRARYA